MTKVYNICFSICTTQLWYLWVMSLLCCSQSTCTSNTENAATQSTASLKLEELEDKSQFQKEPCAEEPRQTVQHVEG